MPSWLGRAYNNEEEEEDYDAREERLEREMRFREEKEDEYLQAARRAARKTIRRTLQDPELLHTLKQAGMTHEQRAGLSSLALEKALTRAKTPLERAGIANAITQFTPKPQYGFFDPRQLFAESDENRARRVRKTHFGEFDNHVDTFHKTRTTAQATRRARATQRENNSDRTSFLARLFGSGNDDDDVVPPPSRESKRNAKRKAAANEKAARAAAAKAAHLARVAATPSDFHRPRYTNNNNGNSSNSSSRSIMPKFLSSSIESLGDLFQSTVERVVGKKAPEGPSAEAAALFDDAASGKGSIVETEHGPVVVTHVTASQANDLLQKGLNPFAPAPTKGGNPFLEADPKKEKGGNPFQDAKADTKSKGLSSFFSMFQSAKEESPAKNEGWLGTAKRWIGMDEKSKKKAARNDMIAMIVGSLLFLALGITSIAVGEYALIIPVLLGIVSLYPLSYFNVLGVTLSKSTIFTVAIMLTLVVMAIIGLPKLK
jgi:hypothetical protein